MILTCNYEELNALGHGARAYLDDGSATESAVRAPSANRIAVESLLERLDEPFSLRTLSEQREVEHALAVVVGHLREALELRVVTAHPAAEESVGAYFDFAHALSVLGRVRDMGEEMLVLVEVITGAPPDEEAIREFVFPD